ncbi:MAG: hypothetical protein ABJA78_08690 [Ferruginibacter sp.]
MMIKKLQLAAVLGLIFCSASTKAQLTIDNATFYIESGATVTVQGDILSNVSIQGPGKVLLKGTGNQNVNMNNGGAATNAYIIPNLEIDNTSNVTLTGNTKVGTSLLFTNGKIQTAGFDLKIANAATVTGADNTKYVVTNGTGRLIREALAGTAFTYPIGNTTTTYNPVTISNSGTADDIGVRCLTDVYTAGSTGTPFTKEVAAASWDISEAVASGSNLSLTTNWLTADELPGFNRTKSGISYYIPTAGATLGWDLLNSQTSAATGAGTAASPYSFTRTGITSLGTFAVGTRPVLSPLLVSPKIFLQGPYNTTNFTMDNNLRLLTLIPTLEPYTGATGFTHNGSGGGETAAASLVGPAAPANNDAIVDWVFVQLHSAVDGSILSTRAALIQRDGDVVETDGVSPLNMAGNAAGNYYVSIRHRNHLGVRSASSFSLAKTTTTSYDFTNALSKAFAGAVSNNAMATVNTGVFGMWAGNANDDLKTNMTGLGPNANDYAKLLNVLGSSTTSILNIYSKQDLNMDGKVIMTGLGPAANDYAKLLNVLGSSVNVITQPTF